MAHQGLTFTKITQHPPTSNISKLERNWNNYHNQGRIQDFAQGGRGQILVQPKFVLIFSFGFDIFRRIWQS